MFTFLSPARTIAVNHPEFKQARLDFDTWRLDKTINNEALKCWSAKLYKIDSKAASIFFLEQFLNFHSFLIPSSKELAECIDFSKIKNSHDKFKFLRALLTHHDTEIFLYYFSQQEFKKIKPEFLIQLQHLSLHILNIKATDSIFKRRGNKYNRLDEENLQKLSLAFEYRSTTKLALKELEPEIKEWCIEFLKEFYKNNYLFHKSLIPTYYESHSRATQSQLFNLFFQLAPDYFLNQILPQNPHIELNSIVEFMAINYSLEKFKTTIEHIECFQPEIQNNLNFNHLIGVSANKGNLEIMSYLITLAPQEGKALIGNFHNYSFSTKKAILEVLELNYNDKEAQELINKCIDATDLELYSLCQNFGLHHNNHDYSTFFRTLGQHIYQDEEGKMRFTQFFQEFLKQETDLDFLLHSEQKGLIKLVPEMKEYIYILKEQRLLSLNCDLVPTPTLNSFKKPFKL